MKTAACPSCGAPVVFRSAASILAVCEYCQSTLVRHDKKLEDIGRMATLAEDRSPLQLGAEGQWKGRHFALIGRIQLQYSQGLWNEWYLLFDDQRTAWLSEAGGEYVLTQLKWVPETLPRFEELKVEQRVLLDGIPWTVTNIENATCIAGEGELPFKVGPGYPAPLVDMRHQDRFATLDFSEQPPWFFVGAKVDLPTLHWQNLRPGVDLTKAPTIAAKVFRCPGCGSPLSARSEAVQSVGCPACGTVVDTSANKELAIISKAQGANLGRQHPTLALGSRAQFEGETYELIGYLVQEATQHSGSSHWREYLLAPTADFKLDRYRWLVEYEGHWNWVEVLSELPRMGYGPVHFRGDEYPHFATYETKVFQVAGEFPWRVAVGDVCEVSDYYRPPALLSRERTGKEITWSRGTYLSAAEVAAAFGDKRTFPEAKGIYANQPNPWQATSQKLWKYFWLISLLALVLQWGFKQFGGQEVLRHQMYFSPLHAEETQTTPVFHLSRSHNHLHLENLTNLDNNWAVLDMQLVEKETGRAYPLSREISYYRGVDEGESWSEGKRHDEVVLRDLPPGNYYLAVDSEFSDENPLPFGSRVVVSQNKVGWSNFVFLELFLLIFPLFAGFRKAAFEAGRLAESDYAPDDEED